MEPYGGPRGGAVSYERGTPVQSANSTLQQKRAWSHQIGEPLKGRCKATWKREFKLPWREAGPPNHLNDKVNSDQ